jgi:hypothetical protein
VSLQNAIEVLQRPELQLLSRVQIFPDIAQWPGLHTLDLQA